MDTKSEKIKRYVKERYAEAARRTEQNIDSSCCVDPGCSSSCCGTTEGSYVSSIGYSEKDLSDLSNSVVRACAGCGNPTALAELREGEVVLDLGSGGGLDVFLAAGKVGSKGRALGVDMTEEMVKLARRNAVEMGLENVEFRLGEIENLPVEDESVDVIISNCVINLSPDKDRVFSEAFRVLKPGGRMIISDIVSEGELPQEIREDPDAWAGCIGGALDEKIYLEKIGKAGFRDIRVQSKRGFMDIVNSIEVEAHKPRN